MDGYHIPKQLLDYKLKRDGEVWVSKEALERPVLVFTCLGLEQSILGLISKKQMMKYPAILNITGIRYMVPP